MHNLVQLSFDWQSEVAETHTLLNELSSALKQSEVLAVKIGRKLRLFQDNLPHGEFLPLLDHEFGMSRATAYNFMSLAETEEKDEEKFLIIRNFPLYLQYRLASAPISIAQKIESGEIPPTIKAIEEAKKAEKRAEEEAQKAFAKAETAQQELLQVRTESHNAIIQLTQQMEAIQKQRNELQEKITTLSTPEKIEVEKQVLPPETIAQIEQMKAEAEQLQAKLKKTTEHRDRLFADNKELGNDLKSLREATKTQKAQEQHEARIKKNWRQSTETFYKQVMALITQFPSPIDAQVFETEDWNRLAQSEQLARQFLERCRDLHQISASMVIDAR